MLVLVRREQEVICIGNDIEIRVCQISGRRVRLGVQAPDQVRVDRKEVREREISVAPVEPTLGVASEPDGLD